LPIELFQEVFRSPISKAFISDISAFPKQIAIHGSIGLSAEPTQNVHQAIQTPNFFLVIALRGFFLRRLLPGDQQLCLKAISKVFNKHNKNTLKRIAALEVPSRKAGSGRKPNDKLNKLAIKWTSQ
jgi:hypothetical protein